ncbi:MAG: PKD domain-containing protein [Bacteroidota bacterium]
MRRTALLFWVALLSVSISYAQTTYLNENFDTGLPTSWSVGDGGSTTDTWVVTTNGYDDFGTSRYLDGTEFAFVDSDGAGSAATMDDTLFSPIVNTAAASSSQLLLTFDHYFRVITAPDTGYVEVFDGSNWVTVEKYGSNQGNWNAPGQVTLDITSLANANLQVRFVYKDFGNFAWWWAIDNVRLFTPSTDDVGIASIDFPRSACSLPAATPISVTIENFGAASKTNIPLAYSVNGGLPVTATYNGPAIPAGGSVSYTFPTTANVSAAGTYNIIAATFLTSDTDNTNDTATATVVNASNTSSSLPIIEDFDNYSEGTTTFPDFFNDPTANLPFETEDGPSGTSTGTGPDDDVSGGGNYIYMEASGQARGDRATICSGCLDLASANNPSLNFFYHMYGNGIGSLTVTIDTNGVLDTLVFLAGQQQTSNGEAWRDTTVSLLPYVGNSAQICFTGVIGQGGSSFNSDISLDEIRILDPVNEDVGVTAITSPNSGCGLGTQETVTIELESFGGMDVPPPFFIPVSYQVGMGTAVTEFLPVTDTLKTGDVFTYTFNAGADLSMAGTVYSITAYAGWADDDRVANDSLTVTVEHRSAITAYPYFQGFDSAAFVPLTGNPGGTAITLGEGWENDPNDSGQDWAPRNTPTGSSGTGAATDNSGTGNYMYVEDSGFENDSVNLLSPCFDLAGLTCPTLSFFYHSVNAGTAIDENTLHLDIFYQGRFLLDVIPPIGDQGIDQWFSQTVDLTAFPGIVQFRFRVDNNNADFTHDIAIDDVSIFDGANGDIELVAVTSLESGCGLTDSNDVTIEVANLSCAPISNIPVVFTINGTTTVNDTITGTINPGDTTTFTFADTADLSVTGVYNFVVYTDLPADGVSANDTATFAVENLLIPSDPTTTGDTACAGAPAELVASRVNGDFTLWFDNPGGNLISVGDTFTTMPLMTSDTAYAVAGTGGQDDITTTFASNNGARGNLFNVTTGSSSILVDSMNIHLSSSADVDVFIYGKIGPWQGFQGDASAWTLFDSVRVTGNGTGTPTLIETSFSLSPNTTYGMIVSTSLASTGTGVIRYTDGANVYSNSDLTIETGDGFGDLFSTATFSPRSWNGQIFYTAIGCESNPVMATAFVPPNNFDLVMMDTARLCPTDTLTLDAGPGGSSYTWSTGATTQTIGVTMGGTYFADKMDAFGCMYTDTAVVAMRPAITVAVNGITDVACNGDSTGAIDITAGGGTGTLSFNWSNGGMMEDIMNVPAGSYTGVISDTVGCSISATLTVNEPAPVAIALDSLVNVDCNGNTTGGIFITTSGGTAPYTYLWSDGSTGSDLSGVGAGMYSGTITDVNGCVLTSAMITVSEPDPLALAVDGVGNEACPGDSNGFIFITISGGTMPYSYLWSNGATTPDLTNLPGGVYSGTITDDNGCVFTSGNVTISTTDSVPTADFSFSITGGTVDFTNATGNGNNYSWDFGDGSPVVAGTDVSHTYSANAAYTVTLIAYNNCGSDTTTQIVDMMTVGLEEEALGRNISLFPNPTAGAFSISFTELNLSDVSLSLYSMEGKEVYRQGIGTIQGSTTHEVTLENDLAEGVYVLQLTSERFVIHKRVVIRR